MPAPALHDLACVVHLHSLHSDGTGTVPEIARAARRSGADVVLLTDHDTLEAKRQGEEGWYGPVLVLVGEEVSPPDRNHFLAFGLEREIDHRGLDGEGVCLAVSEAGGFGFAAHPFSRGSERFSRARGMPFDGIDCPVLDGIELWSFVTDTGESLGSLRDVLRFVVAPGRVVDHPPERNVREWDRLCRERRVVAIGGLDAHPIVAGQFPPKPIEGRFRVHLGPIRAAPGHAGQRFQRTRVEELIPRRRGADHAAIGGERGRRHEHRVERGARGSRFRGDGRHRRRFLALVHRPAAGNQDDRLVAAHTSER